MKLFKKADNDENKVMSLLSLVKETTGRFPDLEETKAGLSKLGVELTPELISKINEKFPEMKL